MIACYSRGDVVSALAVKPSAVLVSISTPGKNYPYQVEHTGPVLRLAFNDVDRSWLPSETPFASEMATDLVQFLQDNWSPDLDLIVHCDAGQSRSAGIAAAVAKHYTGDDFRFFRAKTPNMLVYRLVLEALHEQEAHEM